MARSQEDSSHCNSKLAGTKKLTQDSIVKITKIPGISDPTDLGTKHLDGG